YITITAPPAEERLEVQKRIASIDVSSPPVGAQHAALSSPTLSLGLLPAPFAWVEIPGEIGKKWTGAPYAIAKYPVTNAQFRVFVAAGGYSQSKWWTDAGWQRLLKDGWTEPLFWTDRKWNGAERPVVGVSWYETVAFCLWLSDRTGEKIMLPTEDQWQYA